MNINIRRTIRNDIEVQTKIALENRRVLHVTTRKNSHKRISTTATVVQTDPKNPEWFTHKLYVDFSSQLALGPIGLRATEKTLVEQHRTALEQIPFVLEAVETHYAKETTKEEA